MRHTVIVLDNGSEWFKVYDGIGYRKAIRHITYWSKCSGCLVLAIVPSSTAELLPDYTDVYDLGNGNSIPVVDIRTYNV